MTFNEELSEILGIILGDGHLHAKSNLITIVGSLEDLKYYKETVIPLFEKVFGKRPILRKRKDRNAYYLTLECKKTMNYLANNLKLNRGSKVNASVPSIIFSKKKYARTFLRGLFDTDGCLKFSKQSKKFNYYPRIQIALRISPLAYELKRILDYLKFPYGTWTETRFNGIIYYQISGIKNMHRWFKEIKPNNKVQITKYEFWKGYGYYIPKSTLNQRNKLLQN